MGEHPEILLFVGFAGQNLLYRSYRLRAAQLRYFSSEQSNGSKPGIELFFGEQGYVGLV
jgi:hypothetical protein